MEKESGNGHDDMSKLPSGSHRSRMGYHLSQGTWVLPQDERPKRRKQNQIKRLFRGFQLVSRVEFVTPNCYKVWNPKSKSVQKYNYVVLDRCSCNDHVFTIHTMEDGTENTRRRPCKHEYAAMMYREILQHQIMLQQWVNNLDNQEFCSVTTSG